jgi:8-oxo-dGTP pyrophosphatase MutT (NUDIX family)
MSDRGTTLLLRRTDTKDWDYPGGRCRDGETVAQCAVREAWEEVGFRCGHAGTFHCRRVVGNIDYTTFTYRVDTEFVPKLNREHDLYLWVNPKDVLPKR